MSNRGHTKTRSQFFEQENRTHFQIYARAPEKKPVIVNGATKSSARSQRDKTAFLLIIPFWPSSRFTEKEKERATMPVAALGRRTCFFFGCCAEIRRRRRCEILVNYLKTAVISIVAGDVDSITPALISYGTTPSGVHKQFQKYRDIVPGIFLHSGAFLISSFHVIGNVSAAGIKEKSNKKISSRGKKKGCFRFCLKLSGA